MGELWKPWRPPGVRMSNPYLTLSRRLCCSYAAVLWYVCDWEGLPCNVPYPNLGHEDVCKISAIWRHEHDCRERETRNQRKVDDFSVRP